MKKSTRDQMNNKRSALVADPAAPAITISQPSTNHQPTNQEPALTPVQASRARRTETKRFEVRIANSPDAVRDLKKAAQSINKRYGVDE